MPTYKSFGQEDDASTEQTLYTCSNASGATVHSLFICNRSTSAVTFTVALNVGGGATANGDYLYKDEALAANKTYLVTTPIHMANTDTLKVTSSTANVTFNAGGVEY